MRRVLLFLDLARGRSALLSVSEPVLGAMLATGTIPSLRVCLLGILAALAGYFCVYSLNDLLDLRPTARRSGCRRPIRSRGSPR